MKTITIDSKNDDAENIISIIDVKDIKNRMLFCVESRKF